MTDTAESQLASDEPAGGLTPRGTALLAVLCVAFFLDALDVSMVGWLTAA